MQLRGRYNLQSKEPNKEIYAGSYDYNTFIHEVGHGLGLKHPFEVSGDRPVFPGGVNGNYQVLGTNSAIHTMKSAMAYASGYTFDANGSIILNSDFYINNNTVFDYGYMKTTGIFDILALQYYYGANTNYKSGDDAYAIPDGPNTPNTGMYWTTIYDTGGSDTISYGGTKNAIIDLRAATGDTSPTGGGFFSHAVNTYGGFIIAKDSIIENATGGSGADKITGNNVANILTANNGNDTVTGAGGDDALDGGGGSDTAIFSGARSEYTVSESSGVVTVADKTTGRDGTDTLKNFELFKFSDKTYTLAELVGPPAGSTFSLSASTYSVSEAGGKLTVTVNRTGDLSSAAKVTLKTSDVTATAGADYTAVDVTLDFAINAPTATVDIPILQDLLVETTETFSVTLSSPTGNATLGTTSTATVSILDDEVAAPTITITPASVLEGNAGLTDLVFTLTRSGSTTSPFSVNYATQFDTADTDDFVAATGLATFLAGEATTTVTVKVKGDTIVEPNETLKLVLTQLVSGWPRTPTRPPSRSASEPSSMTTSLPPLRGETGAPRLLPRRASRARMFARRLSRSHARRPASPSSMPPGSRSPTERRALNRSSRS